METVAPAAPVDLGVDGVFVINLERSRERMARMDAQLRALGVAYERFEAVDGAKLSEDELRRMATGSCQAFCTPSTLGCALSHMGVWQAVLARGMQRAIVIEDDARLAPGFVDGVRRALANVPDDFDVLLLGCFFLCDKDRKYSAGHALTRLATPGVIRDDRRTWGNVFVPEFFGGTHCYIVSNRGCANLLRLLPKANFHIDVEMNHPELRLYAVSPDLAHQGPMSESTIASFSFPRTLTPMLDGMRDTKNIPAAYYLDAPWGQVAGIRLNWWGLLFFLLGLFFRHSAAPYVAGFFLAEVVVGGAIVPPLLFFLCGWLARAGMDRLV